MTTPAPNGDMQRVEIPDFEIESLARCLLPQIQAFHDSPEGQAAFAEWKQHQEQQGK